MADVEFTAHPGKLTIANKNYKKGATRKINLLLEDLIIDGEDLSTLSSIEPDNRVFINLNLNSEV